MAAAAAATSSTIAGGTEEKSRKRKIDECLDEQSSEQISEANRLPTLTKAAVGTHLESLDEAVLKSGEDLSYGLTEAFGNNRWVHGLTQKLGQKFTVPEEHNWIPVHDRLQQLIRAVDKLVQYALVTGTAVNKQVLLGVSDGRDASSAAKTPWKDVPMPSLLDWPGAEAYIRLHKNDLADWLNENTHYRDWFTCTRARVIARLLELCVGKTQDSFPVQLEALHAEVCNPESTACLLHSNLVSKNLSKEMVGSGKSFRLHLAEYVLFGEINGEDGDPRLDGVLFCGVGNPGKKQKLEPLALDCLKRIPAVMDLVPEVLTSMLGRLNASSAGFLFEYPVAYAVARVAAAQDLVFLAGKTLAEAVKYVQQHQLPKWYAVLPDRFAGPDVVLFHIEAQPAGTKLTNVKVVQSKLYGGKLAGNELKHALNTTDLKHVYMRQKGASEIMSRSAERSEIIEFVKSAPVSGFTIERILVCSSKIDGATSDVEVITRETPISFLGHSLWSLVPEDG